MRQNAGTINRLWLTIIGLVLLLAGAALLLQAGGLFAPATPTADSRIGLDAVRSASSQPWFTIAALVVGLVIALLALGWIIAQVPRKNSADVFRLQAEDGDGYTLCDPSVLDTAIEAQIAVLPDVVSSSALLRGTAGEPDLTMRITTTEQADVPALLRRLDHTVLTDLSTALDAPLARCRTQIDVSDKKQSAGTVVRSTGTVVH